MLKVAVLGGGNGAFIAAADLAIRGYDVSLCESPQFAESITKAKEQGGIELEVRGKIGLKGGFAKLSEITTDVKKAVEGRSIIFVVVPAFAQSKFAELAGNCFSKNQIVILQPGNFGGSLEFTQILLNQGAEELPILMEFECMSYSGFKDTTGSAWVSGFKKPLKAAVYPGKYTDYALKKVREIYPDLERGKNIFETGLSNTNTTLHAPILALNAGWAEQPEQEFLLYWEGCSPGVVRVAEEIDRERIEIGKRLGLDPLSTKDILLKWYSHQGAKGDTLREVLTTNPVYEWDYAPKTFQHRFFLEDIPYGMAPMETIGQIMGVKTPLITAIIEIGCVLAESDLRADSRDLRKFGIADMTPEEINEFLYTGGKYEGLFLSQSNL